MPTLAEFPLGCVDDELARFEAHMAERGLQQKYIGDLRPHAAQFLDYINRLGIVLAAVEPDHVKAYFRVALRTQKKRRPNRLKSLRHWRMISTRSVHGLLRFAQGEWRPGSRSLMLERFRAHSELLRYNGDGMASRISAARQFLVYLGQQGTSLEEARPSHVAAFVQTKLEVFRTRHGCFAEELGQMAEHIHRPDTWLRAIPYQLTHECQYFLTPLLPDLLLERGAF